MLEQLRAVVSLVGRAGQPDFEMAESRFEDAKAFVCRRVTLLAVFWICVLEISSSRICQIYHERWVCV